MARFEYLEARSLRQAVSLLERHGEEARLVAGSTDFLVRWRQGVWRPQYVVDIRRIASLSRISYSNSRGLRLGPLAKVQDLETHPAVTQRYPALAAAAASFAGVQVRNLATVGGNICNASPAGDTLPALLAFDAECRVVGPEGERWLPLASVFAGPGRTVLQHSEVLAEVRLPPPAPNSGSLYIKHSPRGAMDIATLGVASVLSLEVDGQTCPERRHRSGRGCADANPSVGRGKIAGRQHRYARIDTRGRRRRATGRLPHRRHPGHGGAPYSNGQGADPAYPGDFSGNGPRQRSLHPSPA